MKTIPLACALAVLTAAGGAVAGQIEIRNCNQATAWLNAYVYNEKDVVRLISASEVQGLRHGQRTVLTCATGRCAVTLEFPKYVGKTMAGSSQSSVYNFSGSGDGITGTYFVGVRDQVCSRMRYDSEGNHTDVDFDSAPGCSCN
jgi:hypothetical protein